MSFLLTRTLRVPTFSYLCFSPTLTLLTFPICEPLLLPPSPNTKPNNLLVSLFYQPIMPLTARAVWTGSPVMGNVGVRVALVVTTGATSAAKARRPYRHPRNYSIGYHCRSSIRWDVKGTAQDIALSRHTNAIRTSPNPNVPRPEEHLCRLFRGTRRTVGPPR